jgi:16S rRNA (guanine527-N7)-methyltransferase
MTVPPLTPPPLTPEEFQAETGATAQQVAALERYLALLIAWQGRVNLVGASTLADPWRRHMLDSAQLLPLIPPCAPARAGAVLDVGSGAGFPGLVLAVLGVAADEPGGVHLVESDGRKCAFLREAVAVCGAAATVHHARSENPVVPKARVVTARAWGPVARILKQGLHLLAPGGQFLLLKGARVDEELTEAAKRWTMRVERFPSRSDSRGQIVRIQDIHPK